MKYAKGCDGGYATKWQTIQLHDSLIPPPGWELVECVKQELDGWRMMEVPCAPPCNEAGRVVMLFGQGGVGVVDLRWGTRGVEGSVKATYRFDAKA